MEISMVPMSINRRQWKSLYFYTPDPKESLVDSEENTLAHKGTTFYFEDICCLYSAAVGRNSCASVKTPF